MTRFAASSPVRRWSSVRKPMALALAATAAVTLAACGSSSKSASGGTAGGSSSAGASSSGSSGKQIKKVDFAVATLQGDVYNEFANNLKAAGAKIGVEVKVYNNNGAATDMVSNANLMIQDKPDVILDEPAVADAAARVGSLFKSSGIPCIAVNVGIPQCKLFNFDQPYLSKLAAAYYVSVMQQKHWTAADTTVLIGQNSSYGPGVNIAVTSFYDALSGSFPGMTHVAACDISGTTTTIGRGQDVQVDLGTTLDDAFTAMTRLLSSLPKGKHVVIYSLSDSSTQGVIRALTNAGRVNDAIINGYGESSEAINSVRRGSPWIMESAGFFTSWGQFLIAEGQALLNGVSVPDVTAPPMVAITKGNVDTYFQPGGAVIKKFPPLPAASSYLAKTGVLQKFGNVEGVS